MHVSYTDAYNPSNSTSRNIVTPPVEGMQAPIPSQLLARSEESQAMVS